MRKKIHPRIVWRLHVAFHWWTAFYRHRLCWSHLVTSKVTRKRKERRCKSGREKREEKCRERRKQVYSWRDTVAREKGWKRVSRWRVNRFYWSQERRQSKQFTWYKHPLLHLSRCNVCPSSPLIDLVKLVDYLNDWGIDWHPSCDLWVHRIFLTLSPSTLFIRPVHGCARLMDDSLSMYVTSHCATHINSGEQ